MAATGTTKPRPRRWLLHLVVLAVLIGAVVWAGLAFKNTGDTNADAQHKAEQLKSRLTAAGLQSAEVKVLANTFGTDGGIACQGNPDNALLQSDYQTSLSNEAGAGPGNRPVIGDADMAEATSIVIATYCPDNLGAWLKHVRDNLSLQERSTQ